MRPTRHVPIVAVLAALSASCADVAPIGGPEAVPSFSSGSGSAGSGTASFIVYPSQQSTFVLGDHRIRFSENAVCDPARSTYGAGEWDRQCEVALGGVRITARWWTDDRGHPRIDFQPSLRFNPASNVTLWLMDKDASEDPRYKMFWVDPSGALVDESVADTSVATHVANSGHMYRRVKHFSGYTLSTGRLGLGLEVELSLDRNGARPTPPEAPKSGHLVASGRARKSGHLVATGRNADDDDTDDR
jgi:hypothetical protein